MEFLSEDIYGGVNNFYSGSPEAQPWYSMQGLTSPYGVYGLNRAGLLAQQNLPVTAGGLNVDVNVDGQAIRDQVNQNLLDQGVSPNGLFSSGMNNEMPPPGDDQRPSDNPGGEDSPFDIIMRTIVGQIGNPEDVSPEVVAVLNGYLDGSDASELEEIGRQIVEAGGFEEWLATQDIQYGDPGGIFEPDPTDPDTDFPAPEQVGISLEDFQSQFEGLDPSEYEDGMYTDPATGIVYVINMPPDLTEPDPEDTGDTGGGGSGGGTEGGGDNTSGGGSVDGSEGNQDSVDDEFFRVEDGQVYVRDIETGEWVLAEDRQRYEENPETGEFEPVGPWWGGYLGDSPEDGSYTDSGTRIDDGSEVNVGGDDESSGGATVTITPGTGGTSGTSGSGNSGGGTGGTGGGNQTGNTGDSGSGQNPGDGTAGSGGGTGTGTGTGGGSGSGPGNGTGSGLFKDAVNKFQGVDATVRFNDPGIPQLIGGRKPQRQSIMGLFQEYL